MALRLPQAPAQRALVRFPSANGLQLEGRLDREGAERLSDTLEDLLHDAANLARGRHGAGATSVVTEKGCSPVGS